MKRSGLLVGVAGAALLGVVVVVGLVATSPGGSPAESPSPSDVYVTLDEVLSEPFELFDGQVARLTDWQGTPLVVNFWASWCPPCVAEMGEAFEPLHQELGTKVAFVGLNLQDERARAHDVAERTGVTYTLGWDPAGIMFSGFRGIGMPTTVLINAEGEIVSTHAGALTRDQLRTLVQTNLNV